MPITTGDTVTIEYVGRHDDGTVFDTSRESVAEEAGLETAREFSSLTVEVGSGQVIEGLDDTLEGMNEGDTETVTIPPEAGYGERSEDRVVEYDAAEFAAMVEGHTPREGMQIQTEQGLPGTVAHVDDELVRVDFNHDLAGETLAFEVEVLSVE
jgi:FKBP-type peptidyl-prolyl cis-trans isomerase 2